MPIISLIINARNQTQNVLRALNSQVQGLTSSTHGASGGMGSLSNSIAAGVLKANAFTAALEIMGQGVSAFRDKIAEATQLQLDGVNSASTFSALTGQNYEDASKFIDRLNASLAKSAATLPGATQDYKNLAITMQDNLIEAFSDPSGKLNQKEFESSLMSISESFGALTAASTKDIGNTSLGLTKALAGGSLSELRQIAFFEQNPVVLNQLEKALEEQNTTLKDMESIDRIKLLQSVGSKLISEDFKSNASNTVDGLMQSFNSQLFDPTTGIFGVMRDLNPETEGVQSVFSKFNEGVKVTIGPGGLFETAGNLLQAIGLGGIDPMQGLNSGATLVVDWLGRLNSGVGLLVDKIQGGNVVLSDIPSLFEQGTARVRGFFAGIFARVPAAVMQGLVTVQSMFTAETYLGLMVMGAAFGDSVGGLIQSATLMIASLPWGQILITIGQLSIGLIAFVGGFVPSLYSRIKAAIFSGVSSVVGSLSSNFGYMLKGIGQSIAEWVSSKSIALAWRITNAATNLGESIAQGITQFISRAQQKVLSIISNIPIVGRFVGGDSPPAPIANRAMGQIPNAAAGFNLGGVGALVAAASRESRAMPADAKIVVANSTERIIPRGVSTGGDRPINIYVYEATDPEAVWRIISGRLNAEMEAALS